MTINPHRRGWLYPAALLLAGVASLSCGGGGGSHDSGPAFKCSDAPVGMDSVAILCGTKIGKDTWLLEVSLGGPTTSSDISGFNFDVVFDPAELSYVPSSAEPGTLLGQDGDDPLLLADVASNDPGRLIVGIHRTNQPAGVQGAAPENLIMKFCLKTNTPLANFGPDLLQFENAEAVDSGGMSIGSVTFSDQLLLSVE